MHCSPALDEEAELLILNISGSAGNRRGAGKGAGPGSREGNLLIWGHVRLNE